MFFYKLANKCTPLSLNYNHKDKINSLLTIRIRHIEAILVELDQLVVDECVYE